MRVTILVYQRGDVRPCDSRRLSLNQADEIASYIKRCIEQGFTVTIIKDEEVARG